MLAWSSSDKIVLTITLMLIICVALILLLIFRNKSEKVKEIPLIVITTIMLILEVVKQVRDIKTGYSFWTVPLHFCSLFLYFYPLAVFAKGKVKEFGKTMSLVCSLLMFVMFYINPGSIIGSDTTINIFADFGTFHTFIYHHLVILFLITSLMINYYNFKRSNFIYVLVGFTLYAVIMLPMAYALDTNFCNILESNIPFMEAFRVSAGQALYTIVMFLFSIASGLTIILFQYGIEKLIKRGRV